MLAGFSRLVRVPVGAVLPVVGAFLVLSAALKGYQLIQSGMPKGGLIETEGYYTLLIAGEFVFGVWLTTGLYSMLSRILAFLLFAAFLESALWLGFNGRESCGCLGAVKTNPWLMAALDSIILVALVFARGRDAERTIETHLSAFFAFLLVLLSLGLPAVVTMTQFQRVPSGKYPLRQDHFLHNTKVVVALDDPTSTKLIEFLSRKIGVSIDVDGSIRELFAECRPDWGKMNHQMHRCWGVLERLSNAMPVRSRWLKTDRGYVLIADNPWRRSRFFWLGGASFGALGACWIAWNAKRRTTTSLTKTAHSSVAAPK